MSSIFCSYFPVSCSVTDLQQILLEIHDKVNMDLAFMEDRKSHLMDGEGLTGSLGVAPSLQNAHCHTTSYLFMWLLLMEAVRHCTAEVGVRVMR